MQDLVADLELAVATAYKAGEIIKYYIEEGFEDLTKSEYSNGTPLTEVDLRVDKFLNETLMDQTPDYGWISEEKSTENKNGSDRVWVVDPIDGTSCFIKGLPTFSISIALLEHNFPVLGVIYNPVRNQMFYSLRGHGMFLNEQRMTTEIQSLEDSLLLLPKDGQKDFSSKNLRESVSQFEDIGSIAYRMALIAAGQADMTFVDHDISIWDIAAGVAMLEEQDFDIREMNGQYLNYTCSESGYKMAPEGLVVCRDFLFEEVKEKMLP